MHHVNPTCGDEVTLRVRLDGGDIAELGWVGEGCSISQASTSVMSDLVVGKPVENALRLQEKFLELMQSQGQGELTEDEAEALDDAVAFEGVSKYPARVKCALLGWMAMKSAVAEASRGTASRERSHDRSRHHSQAVARRRRRGAARRGRSRAGHQRRRPRA